jgi:hypothetical protein
MKNIFFEDYNFQPIKASLKTFLETFHRLKAIFFSKTEIMILLFLSVTASSCFSHTLTFNLE